MRTLRSGIALASAILAFGAGAVTPAPPQSVSAAPVVLLVDLGTGQTLYAHNDERRFIPASITKIMSAYTAFEMIESGDLSADQTLTMSAAAYDEWYRTGSTMFLEQGDEVPLDTLLRGITSVSANDASVVLAEGAAGSVEAWTGLMNGHARSLGMQNSHFGTPNGWPDGGRTFTTARDLQRLSRALITRHPEEFARYFGQPGLAYNGFAQANHDPISGVIEGADGIKTGFTRQAGNSFVGTAKRGEQRLLMVLAGFDEEPERNFAARELIEWGFGAFEHRQLFAQQAAIGTAKVQNGAAESVPLTTTSAIYAELPKGKKVSMQLVIRYEGPLRAPITAGEQVAQLEITVEGMEPFRAPLVAAQDVEKASLAKRLINGLKGIFS